MKNISFRDRWTKIISNDMTSGILMILAMVSSIICANSDLREIIVHFWETKLFVGLGNLTFSRSLEWWVNDVLMVFFLGMIPFLILLQFEVQEDFCADDRTECFHCPMPPEQE